MGGAFPEDAYLILGIMCYTGNYYVPGARLDCRSEIDAKFGNFNGELDDLGFFAGALTPAEVAARWNASLTDRVAAGQEPNLLMLWNFNDPLAAPAAWPAARAGGRLLSLVE